MQRVILFGIAVVVLCRTAVCQQKPSAIPELTSGVPGKLALNLSAQESLPNLIQAYGADVDGLRGRWRSPLDPSYFQLHQRLLDEWQTLLASKPFDNLPRDEQVDYLLLSNEIQYRKFLLATERERFETASPLIPYLHQASLIHAAREQWIRKSPSELAQLIQDIGDAAKKSTDTVSDDKRRPNNVTPTQALIAAQYIDQVLRVLSESHDFFQGYDPQYSWWAAEPWKNTRQAIQDHASAVRAKLANVDDKDPLKIVGQPIGAKRLAEELRHEMIAYTPDELIRIAEKEFAFCDAEFVKAANELGFAGDWKKALDHVKSKHVEPGEQPALIQKLAWEAIQFVESHELVTVPELAKHDWHIDMLSPEAQRQAPFFLGGKDIHVAFPTDKMAHADKLMSLRSNNIHFCRATVHHELIPGHHLQMFMNLRYRPYRLRFETPFWMEGWALYWEMLLWDLKFAQSAEDRVGMLFWRRHRCARIVFSLNFHLGKWTPEQCVQYLIDRVGHEPSAAAAEVRRSVMGDYSPLYQAAYMIGGLQLRKLHHDLVTTGTMSNRDFHDAILKLNMMPIEMVRASLTTIPLSANYRANWRFAE